MTKKINNGWFDSARQLSSPNCDFRTDELDISLIVIHGISLPPGEFGGPHIDELFTNSLNPSAHDYFSEICTLRVSSHLLIRRDGSLVQYVPFEKRAWHAGESVFADRPDCNDYAIGVELEGTDDTPYEDAQYAQLIEVCRSLITHYPNVTANRIARHSDISAGRKTDPGDAFDWPYFTAQMKVNGL